MYIMIYDYLMVGRDRVEFEAGTGFLLARLGSLSERSWVAMLRERGLTAHQHGVLLALREHGPLPQQRLSRLIAVDPRNMVPTIDALAAKNLIGRGEDPNDRRLRVLTLTGAGRSAADELAAAAARIEDEFLAALNPADRRELSRILRALYASLSGV